MNTLADRFQAKLPSPLPDGCWEWQGFVDQAGYGRVRLGGRDLPVGYAHRVSYEQAYGPIPAGMQIDHRCRNRACVNAAHLEPVPARVNFLRGAHVSARTVTTDRCKRGHAFTENAYVVPKTGARHCRECRRVRRAGGAA